MIPSGIKNPFLSSDADDTTTLPAGHVPELHVGALGKCQQALDEARHTGHKIGLLIRGETGSGKSHLIAQFRHHLALSPNAVLVCVRLQEAFTGRLWRHVRSWLVKELLWGYANPANGANGLLRILRNRFPNWAAAAQGATGGLLDWLIGRSHGRDNLHPYLDDFSRTCDLDYSLRKVLPNVATREVSSLAHSWLKGEQLGPDDLARLGLAPTILNDLEQENQAKSVVMSFLRLAGDRTTLFLCFDQVETLQTGAKDPVALRQFATMATAILAEPGPRVVATFIRPTTQVALQHAVEIADIRKMSQVWGEVPFLTWEQALRVVRARLSAEPTCQAERHNHPSDPNWPPGTPFLESLYRDYGKILTPRLLIQACSREFARIQKSGQDESPVPPERPPCPPDPLQKASGQSTFPVSGTTFGGSSSKSSRASSLTPSWPSASRGWRR